MSQTLRTVLFVLLFAFILQMQFNLDADKTASRQLKNAIEIAVHDAALAIEPLAMGDGRVVFDETLARQYLIESLEKNLNVTSKDGYRFTPAPNSFYKSDIKLEHLEFIDDSDGLTYPFNYINTTYDIIETIDGPSVIAVITTDSPRWFRGQSIKIRQGAVYEYLK